jgi:hypothetical protein
MPPLLSVLVFNGIEKHSEKPKHSNPNKSKYADSYRYDASKSQIINFQPFQAGGSRYPLAGIEKRAPGSLVRVKLLNVVATYETAPVHAQIVDIGLGKPFLGGTLIGEATPDPTFERINIAFRFARDPIHEGAAAAISARALSLDGTLGLDAEKKEGFFTRSVYGSANTATQSVDNKAGSTDFRDILLRALSAGMIQQFGAGAQVEQNKSQVLTLKPGTEFFAELTDYFPGGNSK